MTRDVTRTLLAWLAWIAVTLGVYAILALVLPGLPPMVASLCIIAIISVLLAAGVTLLRWWRAVGYVPFSQWRHIGWLALPAVLTLLPLLAGIKPLDASTYGLLLAGYALTGFAEETMFRGVLIKLLEWRSPMATKGGRANCSRLSQHLATTSGPMPAGSPSETANGFIDAPAIAAPIAPFGKG